ncbi:MAG: SpaH/EbpB family LPXTG-anchored major pilin [Marmoricola sp.]
MSQKFAQGLRRFALAVVVAATVALGLVPIASAGSPSLPDPGQVGSLTIHKTRAGDALSGVPGAPIAGVTFSVQQVTGIDLATTQGWQDASTLSASFDADDASGSIQAAGHGLAAAAGSPVATDAAGEASLSGLPLGLYLVSETSWPAGTTPSAPFVVAVPQTRTEGTGWQYDIDVYPKNSVDGVTKTVEDAGALALGDLVSWTITGDIPNVASIDGYKIVDHLDAKLDYRSATVSLVDGTSVSPGTDFTVAFDSATHTVAVTFTAAGRTLLAAHRATQVVVVVETAVNAVGEVANMAVLYPNQHSFDIAPGEPGGPVTTPPVLTKWGSITVQKTDTSGTPLAGAVFSVYPSKADAQAGTRAVTLDGRSSFPVDAAGRLTISGLRYSAFANGAAVAPGDDGYRTYWLGETAAPQGYERLGEPIEFTVTSKTSSVGVDLVVADVRTAVEPPHGCKNADECAPPGVVQIIHGVLPSTGGPRLVILLGGTLLLIGGVVLVRTSRRRDEI